MEQDRHLRNPGWNNWLLIVTIGGTQLCRTPTPTSGSRISVSHKKWEAADSTEAQPGALWWPRRVGCGRRREAQMGGHLCYRYGWLSLGQKLTQHHKVTILQWKINWEKKESLCSPHCETHKSSDESPEVTAEARRQKPPQTIKACFCLQFLRQPLGFRPTS